MNIVAIGGGDVGSGRTEAIDRELVRLAGKPHPNLLFVPTASGDRPEYVDTVRSVFERLGCTVDALRLYSADDPRPKISWADVIYVGGGNTKSMVELWRSTGVDILLKAHLDLGKPAGGLSAGALCWFRVGNSDWPQFEGIQGLDTARLDCLGFVDLVLCPHCRDEKFRLAQFREMMKAERGVGIGLDDCCALQIRGREYRILASEPDAFAHRVEWVEGALRERTLEPHDDFRPLDGI